jgi:hypothetical protein
MHDRAPTQHFVMDRGDAERVQRAMRCALLVAFLVGCSAPKAPQTSECPAAAPADRSTCARQNVKCNYENEPRCPFAYCADVASKLVWITTLDHCAIACPAAKPEPGAPCSPVTSQSCNYKGGDKCGFVLTCTANGWEQKELTLCNGM